MEQDDYERVAKNKWFAYRSRNRTVWYANRTEYPKCGGRKRTIGMHREIMGFPVGLTVDHRNGNGLNNCRGNLRVANNQQNCRGHKTRIGGTSRFRGVSWFSRDSCWTVRMRVTVGDRTANKNLGYFASEEDAARAYDRAALARDGEFAHTNFPREDYGTSEEPRHTCVREQVAGVVRLQEETQATEVQD